MTFTKSKDCSVASGMYGCRYWATAARRQPRDRTHFTPVRCRHLQQSPCHRAKRCFSQLSFASRSPAHEALRKPRTPHTVHVDHMRSSEISRVDRLHAMCARSACGLRAAIIRSGTARCGLAPESYFGMSISAPAVRRSLAHFGYGERQHEIFDFHRH